MKKGRRIRWVLIGALLAVGVCATAQADKQKISIFYMNANPAATYMKSFGDMLAIKEVEKKFDVRFEYRYALDDTDLVNQVNLAIASGKYPDVFEDGNWDSIAGGIEKAYADGVIIKLNDLIDRYMPNLKALMDKDPRYRREMMNDKGEILGIKRYEPGFKDRPYEGFQIRQDWLNKLGLKKPETIKDLYNTLKAFKGKPLGANGRVVKYPFIGSKNGLNIKDLSVAWGVLPNPYNIRDAFQFDPKTGKVVYGKVLPAYRDFLTEMIKWRDEGLFDPSQLITDDTIFESQAVNGEGGVWYHRISRYLLWQAKGVALDPKYNLSGLKNPIGPAGKPYGVYNFDVVTQPRMTAISSKNKNVEKTLRIIDYYFSPEGSNLLNWGVEGVSYKTEKGQRKFIIDLSRKGLYAFVDWGNPRLMDVRASMAAYNEKQLAETDFWVKAGTDYSLFLPNYSLTEVEAKRLARIMNDITTLTNETVDRILVGASGIKAWDDFVKQAKSMKLDEAIKIVQTAVDRYQARR